MINTKDDTTYGPGADFIFDTATGTKIGTSSDQKIGFYGATPVVRPEPTGGAGSFSMNAGQNVYSLSTFGGYTIGDIVNALKSIGLLT